MDSIVIKNLIKKYGRKTVLNNLNLNIKEGEFYCLMGPNGSGKTTLSSIIASIRTPNSGTVEIYGKKPFMSKDIIGYLPQENFSDSSLTGKENLLFFARMLGYKRKEALSTVNELIDKIGLHEDANKRVGKYSGGMRKRLELATILFPGTKVLILDEPTTGLDPSARRNFFGLIDLIKDKTTTIILITHIGSDAENASMVGLINEGIIIAEGTPPELKNNTDLNNVVNAETSVKNDHIREILSSFNRGEELQETDRGYKIYTNETAEVIPKIVRAVEEKGYRITQIGSEIPSLEDVFFKLTGKAIREVNK
ncbi:MAG: ABC transporter ATP-binding protein [Actinomycetota bacterium]|nr:ABC transporter ATP-binding protein [Actinomycetota bacterium]